MSDLVKRLRQPHSILQQRDAKLERQAADHIEALEAENVKLRTAFRVNMIRLLPQYTHAEIDAEIEKAVSK